MSELESQDVEYVEYLEDDDDAQASQVEYVEAEQVGIGGEVQYDGEGVPMIEGHTIFEHNGRQYMIPEELHRSGQTIVLEDLGGDELGVVDGQWVLPDDSETLDATQLACTYMEVEEGKQFAVLRDGRLHVQGHTEPGVEKKLQALEQSLLGSEEESTEQPEVTGRNLITGQTISLNGFLEKLRKKSKTENPSETTETVSFYSPEIERHRKTYYNHGRPIKAPTPCRPNYVLMPPVNRHVLVGKTPEGKNIVGKILQVWKKVDKQSSKRIRTPRKKESTPRRTIKLLAETDSTQMSSSESLDDNVTRTLSGLMELESVRQSLAHRRLAVRHILKRSIGGRVLPGVRSIAHYYGTMHPAPTPPTGLFLPPTHRWKFVPDPNPKTTNSIDLKVSDDPQQLETSDNEPFGTESTNEEEPDKKSQGEPLPVNLIVIEDENGRKRTKVTIPQLGVRCSSCNKSLRNEQLLRRHELQYHTSDVYSCEVCNRTFSSPGALRRHMAAHEEYCVENGQVYQKIFESSKRYRCRVCGKQFNRHSNMLRHAEIHRAPTQQEDEKSKPAYSCELCGCQYNFVSSLTRHIVNNHLKQQNEPSSTVTS